MNEEFMGFYYNAAKVDKKIENSKIAEVKEELRDEVEKEVRDEVKIEFAKDMYQDGKSLEEISKYTHLSIDYLQKIL